MHTNNASNVETVTDELTASAPLGRGIAARPIEPSETADAEIARLRSDNEDLRASAIFWGRVYDAAIERAAELQAQIDDLRSQIVSRD